MPGTRTVPPKVKKDKVKRPANGWIQYRAHKAREYAATAEPGKPRFTQAELSRYIAQLWKDESLGIKEHWNQLAAQTKMQHAIDNPDYVYTPETKDAKKARLAEEKAKIAMQRAARKDADRIARRAPLPDPSDKALGSLAGAVLHTHAQIAAEGAAVPPQASSSALPTTGLFTLPDASASPAEHRPIIKVEGSTMHDAHYLSVPQVPSFTQVSEAMSTPQDQYELRFGTLGPTPAASAFTSLAPSPATNFHDLAPAAAPSPLASLGFKPSEQRPSEPPTLFNPSRPSSRVPSLSWPTAMEMPTFNLEVTSVDAPPGQVFDWMNDLNNFAATLQPSADGTPWTLDAPPADSSFVPSTGFMLQLPADQSGIGALPDLSAGTDDFTSNPSDPLSNLLTNFDWNGLGLAANLFPADLDFSAPLAPTDELPPMSFPDFTLPTVPTGTNPAPVQDTFRFPSGTFDLGGGWQPPSSAAATEQYFNFGMASAPEPDTTLDSFTLGAEPTVAATPARAVSNSSARRTPSSTLPFPLVPAPTPATAASTPGSNDNSYSTHSSAATTPAYHSSPASSVPGTQHTQADCAAVTAAPPAEEAYLAVPVPEPPAPTYAPPAGAVRAGQGMRRVGGKWQTSGRPEARVPS